MIIVRMTRQHHEKTKRAMTSQRRVLKHNIDISTSQPMATNMFGVLLCTVILIVPAEGCVTVDNAIACVSERTLAHSELFFAWPLKSEPTNQIDKTHIARETISKKLKSK